MRRYLGGSGICTAALETNSLTSHLQGATILGLVLGIATWYVGAGSGPGNPYGIAASTVSALNEGLAAWFEWSSKADTTI